MLHGPDALPPFDLHELALLRAVAKHRSITRAAAEVGLTQSALSRQVQGVEGRLGVSLFDRTTRRLAPTRAGEFLLRETAPVSAQVASTVRRLREEFADGPSEVRLGLSRSVALAHLPGLIHAHVRSSPEVRTRIAHLEQSALLAALMDDSLDLAVMCPPRRLPSGVVVTHRMRDAFTLVAPVTMLVPEWRRRGDWPGKMLSWLARQPWLLFSPGSITGRMLGAWMARRNLYPASQTELDDFDLIIHLVALGLGISLVPQRAIAAFPRRHQLQRIALPSSFARQLVVLTRRTTAGLPRHLQAFVDSILFS